MAVRAVELQAADGLTIRGEYREGGRGFAVLVHDVGQDLDAWRPLRPPLAERGWSVLAIDLRGHGGSDDPWDAERAALDVEAALAFARAAGAQARCVVGAGLGAIAGLSAAGREELDALVLVSPGPLGKPGVEGLRGAGAAKLFVVGSGDAEASAAAEELQRASIGWSLVVSLPADGHGTELLAGECGTQAIEQLLSFLEEQRTLALAPFR